MKTMSKRPRILREKSFVVPDVQNPFRTDINFNIWDYIRIALMSVSVAPLRLLLTTLLLLVAWLLCALAFVGLGSDHNQPLTGWRKNLKWPILAVARIQMFCMGFHSVKVKGRAATPEEARVFVVAPHTTFFDAFVIFMTGLPSGVSRQENIEVPLFGTLVQFLQPVSVSRKDPDSRQKTIATIKQRTEPGSQWPQLVIFPEGTTTNGSCFITFKGGAFIPGVPIQPVLLSYGNRINTFIWTWEGPGTLRVLWLSLCNWANYLQVEFLPVYRPSPEEVKDPRLFSNNVRRRLAQHKGVPVTDHTYEDCRLMEEASRMGLPCDVGAVEFHKLLSKLGIRLENLKTLLTKFAAIASSEGYIEIQDLARYLNVPVSPVLQDMFSVYDRDGSGKIDFREYVIGCSLVTQPANTEETIRMAFTMFGGEKEFILREDLFTILDNAFGMERDETDQLFSEVDTFGKDQITYDEFKAYAMKKPEYSALFTHYLQRPDADQSQPTSDPSPRQRSDHSKKDD